MRASGRVDRLFDGRDIWDRPIDVGPNANVDNVTLGFHDCIGSVEGSLTDATGAAAPAYFVLAFPAVRESWTTTSRRVLPAVQTGTDGRYRIAGLLPGEYYLAVVTEAGREDTADPADPRVDHRGGAANQDRRR